jgi:hypothetical protein
MATDRNEPQSYGSGEEWVTGETAEEVNSQKSTPPPEHREFYDSRRDSEGSDAHQGGHTSGVQLADCDHANGECDHGDAATTVAEQPVTKVTADHGGARHDSFFRKRDYE